MNKDLLKEIKLHEEAGLITCGQQDGEQLYMGTDAQWERYDRLIEMEGREKLDKNFNIPKKKFNF